MVMKAAEDGHRYDAAHVLDGAIDRSVLVERPMSPQLIIQLGNITPTGPRNGKFFIPGIHGLAAWCSFMKS
jgi:hypothetical protein